ncbi:hypothetical protein Pyrfu_0136 [Pyrolobus fumarii 1A]|uniref:Uncharacterized protein n=1 Tax=Pyrolobus fumarii (strain DSM 11204 / 1A) TaxID=694429 RepID=G0EEG7_PYRF1|nr:hypothetical protein [Pyrolobus fumarii]AEM38008.1 hypothetical protein Pyrfu_0136 [Pyrolobus fumarii 1A]
MHRLRLILLASLVLALEGYASIIAYFCPSLFCFEGGFWLLWGLWLGLHAAIIARCRVIETVPFPVVVLAVGYGVLTGLALVMLGVVHLALVAFAASILSFIAMNRFECGALGLSSILVFYTGVVALLSGVEPLLAAVVPTSLLAGFLVATLYVETYLLSRLGGRHWLVTAALGFTLLAIAGFVAAYTMQPYRLLFSHEYSSQCSWSKYCVYIDTSTELPLASWGYTLLNLMQLALTGSILALPTPRRR